MIILGASPNGSNAAFVDAWNKVMQTRAALGGGSSLDQTIARIYYSLGQGRPNLTDIPTVASADSFLSFNGYYTNLDFFVNNGGRNVIIFSELNDPNEPQYPMDARVMGYLAAALLNRYYNNGNRLLYMLFPGPTGLLSSSDFTSYWNQFDLLNSGSPQTFAQRFGGGNVDPAIANSTMLWHGGRGIFDRVALHCYANDPPTLANASVASNLALQYIQWMLQIDPTGWIYVTEAGGQCQSVTGTCPDGSGCWGDSGCAGGALADFEASVSALNAQAVGTGGFGGIVQAVHGYILDYSNPSSNQQGRHTIASGYINGYNAERNLLFP